MKTFRKGDIVMVVDTKHHCYGMGYVCEVVSRERNFVDLMGCEDKGKLLIPQELKLNQIELLQRG